jgi:alkylation response protein AidB-like acyl-CoA dehydrogenase
MARGTRFFAIGLSEPEAGSDLAALTTSARHTDDGWVISGSKVWTSNAHRCHHIVVLARTNTDHREERRPSMTQFVVDVPTPGLMIRPIRTIGGEEHFCEVFLDDVRVPESAVLGQVGDGWSQAMAELADERSGPERYLSTMPLMRAWLREENSSRSDAPLGRAAAALIAAREASIGVAAALERGDDVALPGALVKDVGSRLEQELVELVGASSSRATRTDELDLLLSGAVRHAPGFTLRGGTTEILRSIVGRALA